MTDFYSVLKSSIVRRNLRSPDDRRDVYHQARKAMINKLWSFEPPLAEDEIDTRIGLFDAAVERIESDLELAFAETDAIEAERPRRREAPRRLPPPEPPRQPLVYEGYDEEADYAPAFGGRTAPREERQEWQQPPRRDSYDEPPALRRYEQRGEAGRQQARSEWIAPAARPADQWERGEERGEEPRDDDFHADPGRDGGGRHEEHYEEAAYEEPPAREAPRRTGAYQAPKYREEEAASGWRPAAPQQQIDEQWESAAPADDHDFQDEEEAYAEVERAPPGKKKKKGRKQSGKQATRGGRSPVRILALTIAGLAVALIAFNIYVFLPIILGPERTTSAPAVTPPKMDDRLPAADGAAAASPARIVADSATASEVSERHVDVVESLVVFDGRDPTMFEGSPDNPIRFASDAEGEYARISSATSAAGARAVIGPGLAERLAGRTVRITLLARASAENGAPSLRFAHQSGVAISPWQTAQLTDTYGTYAMIWRVPAGDSRGGDYLLIEPGIPGDGTSTDIRSIKIDILAS